MDIVLSAVSEIPLYEQIRQQLAAQILTGELKAEHCLPSIRMVAQELNISVITVKKAWDMLESEGLIYTRAGKGCFVRSHSEPMLEDKKISSAEARLKKDLDFYRSLGLSLEDYIELIKKNY